MFRASIRTETDMSTYPQFNIGKMALTNNMNNPDSLSIDVYKEMKEDITRKLLRNGQIYIQRGDKTYTIQGQIVK